MRSCPFCEGEISNTAKKCKHCGEWVVGKKIEINEEDDYDEDVSYIKKKSKKNILKNKKNHDGDGQLKFSKIISDNFVFIIIGVIIIFIMAKSLLKDSNKQGNYIDEEINKTVENSEIIDDDETEFSLKGGNNSIIATNYGYTLFPNTVGECEIKGEREIKAFIEAVKNTEDGDVIDWDCPRQYNNQGDNGGGTDVGILFDNAYSKNQNGEIDEKGPDQRMALLGDYMRENRLLNGSKIDFTYMFTIIPDDNSEEPDDNLYRFTIDSSVFPITYIKNKGGNNIRYIDGRYFLSFENTEISYTFSGIKEKDNKCISQSVNSYTCYDSESVYQKIKNIYDTNYDKDVKHTNNMLVKTLATKNNRFSGLGKKDEIYIITNGEFKIGYEWEVKYLSNLKQKYKNIWKHDAGADKTHNLTDFNMVYANWYQKDSKYESFWSDAIDVLRPQLPSCDDVIIHVIGLANSAEFKPLAENVYRQIFDPCIVSFK